MEAKRGKVGAPNRSSTKAAKEEKKELKYVPRLTAEEKTLAGRARKLMGRAGGQAAWSGGKFSKEGKPRSAPNLRGLQNGSGEKSLKPPEQVIFEGHRARAEDGKPKDLKFKGSRSSHRKKSAKLGRRAERGP
jgi:nucleolar protein 12